MIMDLDRRNMKKQWDNIQSCMQLEMSRSTIFTDELLEQFLRYTGARDSEKLVDVGCGTGAFTRYLYKGMKGKMYVTGVDSNYNFIKYARSLAKKEHCINLNFCYGDAYNLPLDDNSVDAVTDHTLLINLPDAEKFIKEELRILRPGGTISTSTFLFDYSPPERLIQHPEFEMIQTIQKKVRRALELYLFPKAEIGANDENIYNIILKYQKLGVKDLEIHGMFPLFSPDNCGQKKERLEYLKNRYDYEKAEFMQALDFLHQWDDLDLDRQTVELGLELLEKQFDWEKGHATWILSNNLEVIISGKK